MGLERPRLQVKPARHQRECGLYRIRLFRHDFAIRRQVTRALPDEPRGGLEAQFFETPFVIVSILERDGSSTNFFNVFEQTSVDSLLLHGPIETLGDAVGLRLGNVGVAWRNPPELDLGTEVV
ncbi:MAG: hypothetical protein VB142_06435 [Burkholderia sp.]